MRRNAEAATIRSTARQHADPVLYMQRFGQPAELQIVWQNETKDAVILTQLRIKDAAAFCGPGRCGQVP